MCILVYFQSCQKDDDFLENGTHFGPKFNHQKTRIITGKEAKKIKEMMFTSYSNGRKTGRSSLHLRDDGQYVDYAQIIEVIDSFGNTNYTFKIINHPEKTDGNFFNLVFSVKDGQSTIELLKYVMDEDFKEDYYNNLKEIHEFKGMVYFTTLSSTGPCDPIEVDPLPLNPTLPSDGNTSGGGTISGGGNPSGPGGISGGEPSGGSNGGSSGNDISIYYQCDDCGSTYSTLQNFYTSKCKNDTYTTVITFNRIVQNTPSNPCPKAGQIGMLPDTDGKKYLKKLLTTSGFLNKIASLQEDASDTQNNSEHGFSIAYSQPNLLTGTVFSGGFDYIRVLKGLNIVGFAHCHTLNGYPMFTVSDLINLNVIKNASTLNQSPELFTFILVTEDNVFAYQIKNVDQYNAFCDLMNSDLKKFHRELTNKYENKTNTSTSSTRYLNDLVSFLIKYQAAITVYKLNSDQTDWENIN
jgi:hypothetical protein